MRQHVHARLAALLRPGSRVLEIGCGAGIDTLFLRRQQATVVACDPSGGMLSETEALLKRHDGLTGVTLVQAGAAQLPASLDPHASNDSFDGIFSDFGAPNCEDDLSALRALAVGRLRPGGWVLLCLLNRFCWIETTVHLLRGHPKTAFRRLSFRRGPIHVDVEGIDVPTFYHRPSDIARALKDVCTTVSLRGLAVMIPPPYWANRWARWPASVRRGISRIDEAVAPHAPFNRAGDHYLIELVKR